MHRFSCYNHWLCLNATTYLCMPIRYTRVSLFPAALTLTTYNRIRKKKNTTKQLFSGIENSLNHRMDLLNML